MQRNNVINFIFLIAIVLVINVFACKTPRSSLPSEAIAEVVENPVVIPKFRKVIVDTVFRSEAITTADLNIDGYLDIIIGDVWFEGPKWNMHQIRPSETFDNGLHKWGEKKGPLPYYSNSFAVQAIDVNKDGWDDILIYPVMNEPVYWYENPQGKAVKWKEYIAYNAYHGESPLLAEFEKSNKFPLAGFNVSDTLMHLGMIKPKENVYEEWELYAIGHTSIKRFKGPGWNKLSKYFAPGAIGHGLGIGDINGDGYDDVLTRSGWYESPKDLKKQNWNFHYMPFDSIANPETPQYQFAQMEVFDIDRDGDADFFGSSAHQYGLWWFEQIMENEGTSFLKHDIPHIISQAHAVAKGDLNNNGIPDLITGKRYLAHTGNDPGWDDPVELLWLEPTVNKAGQVEWVIETIDIGVGVGTQIEIQDIDKDGMEDILVSNKKGTYVFMQEMN